MAQLVIKREPWWSTPFGKQVMIWVPVAGLQAATLAGLGYFYDRLAEIELYGDAKPDFGGLSRDVPVSVETAKSHRLVVASLSSVPVSGAVSLTDAVDSGSAKQSMRAGESFSAARSVAAAEDVAETSDDAPSIVPQDKGTASKKDVLVSSPPVVLRAATGQKKPVEKRQKSVTPAPRDLDSRRTAQANLAGIHAVAVTPEKKSAVDVVPVTPLPTANPDRPFNGSLTPVGIVTWIYIGELRDYGWHGQKLHVAPRSGLPEIGRNYRTQKIHGLYEEPYGKRVMAGFQQGDTVTVLDVMQEGNNKVWAKVRKVHSYGR